MAGGRPQASRPQGASEIQGAVKLYFFERITAEDFVGPIIIAAGDETEAWAVLSRREGESVQALRGADWQVAQELAALPARATIVYPSHYRRAILSEGSG